MYLYRAMSNPKIATRQNWPLCSTVQMSFNPHILNPKGAALLWDPFASAIMWLTRWSRFFGRLAKSALPEEYRRHNLNRHCLEDTVRVLPYLPYSRRCKTSSVGQSAGLSIQRSSVRFRQKNPKSRTQTYMDLSYTDAQARVLNYCS